MTAWWPCPIIAREEVGATGGSAGDEAGWPVSCRNQLAATSPVLGSQAMAHHTRLYLQRALGIELNVLLQARQALYQPSYPSSPKLYFSISSGAERTLGCSLDLDGCVFVHNLPFSTPSFASCSLTHSFNPSIFICKGGRVLSTTDVDN